MTSEPAHRRVPNKINIAQRLVATPVGRGRGAAPALSCDGTTLTYAALLTEISRAANALKNFGIARGDRIVFQRGNSIGYAVAILGSFCLGAVAVPVSTLFRSEELKSTFEQSEPALVIADENMQSYIDQAKRDSSHPPTVISAGEFDDLARSAAPDWSFADTSADDCAYTIYTSGSTGSPKGVEHAHRSIVAAGNPVVEHQLANATDLRICVPTGLASLITLDYGLLWPLYAGGHGYLMGGRFDIDRFARYIAQESINVIVGVPTMFRRMLSDVDVEKRHDLSTVTAALCGGEPLEPELHQAVEARLGFRLYEMMGSSEAHPFIANPINVEPRRGSMGIALAGRECSIRTADGSECAPGETGHLCIAGNDSALAQGYAKRETEWRQSFKHGQFYTGDLASRDSDGYFWYDSRADDLIISRGYRVSPTEIERSALKHPAISRVIAVGVTDAEIGQTIRLYVVLKTTFTPSDQLKASILATAAAGLAPYKAPKELFFVTDLPTTMSGKLARASIPSR